MDYSKKILVLKQVTDGFSVSGKSVSGIFRLETENGVATLSLSVINLSAVNGGCFYLFFMDDKKVLYTFELGKRPFSITKVLEICPCVDKGLAVGISFIKDNLPVLIAFATENRNVIDMSDFKKAVTDKCISERRKSKTEPQTVYEKPEEKYDDEIVATENYYLNDENFEDKLNIIERMDYEYVRNENGEPYNRSEKKAQEKLSDNSCLQNETDGDGGKNFNEQNPYYRTAKHDLDLLFCKFPAEETLTRSVANSKWVRVHYSDSKYYVVGLIKECGREKYICYGVPARYSKEPPKELKGFCSFIPLSVFDLKGDGYWMMFQDAVTGECVKINR